MSSRLEIISNLERSLNIAIPAEQVSEAFSQAYQQINKEVTIKGFRKGKAPISTIRTIYGDRVKQDVMESLISKHYSSALDEHKLDPITFPSIKFEKPIEPDSDFSFIAHFEIRPALELKRVEGLEVKKEKFEWDESRLAPEIEELLYRHSQIVDDSADRPIEKKGDIAVIDFRGLVNNEPIENGSATDYPLEIGHNQFLLEFEQGLMGMKVGEEKEIEVRFPADYHAESLAGKEAQFHLKVKALKIRKIPELTDDFVKGLPQAFATVEELKESIRENLKHSEQRRIDEDLEKRILRVLDRNNFVEVPPSLGKEQKEELIRNVTNRMKQQGFSEAEVAEHTKKWDEHFNETAKFMVRSSFLVDAVAEKFHLGATDSDVQREISYFESVMGKGKKSQKIYDNPETRSRIRYRITERQVVKYLIDHAHIVEVSKEEIAKADDTI